MIWHNYPQHPDSHPDLPWWRKFGGCWKRADGLVVFGGRGGVVMDLDGERAMLYRVPIPRVGISVLGLSPVDFLGKADAMHPLRPPPPLCGQVWVDLAEDSVIGHMSIIAVGRYMACASLCVDTRPEMFEGRTPLHHQFFRHAAEAPPHIVAKYPEVEWPPENAAQVAKDYLPWRDTSAKETP